MPNRNYINGANKERQVMKMLERVGYNCSRSAGSHGFYDIKCHNSKEHRLIQIKYNCDITPAELDQIELDKVPENTTKEVWLFKKGNTVPKIVEVK